MRLLMQELGVDEAELGRMMSELTYKVADGK